MARRSAKTATPKKKPRSTTSSRKRAPRQQAVRQPPKTPERKSPRQKAASKAALLFLGTIAVFLGAVYFIYIQPSSFSPPGRPDKLRSQRTPNSVSRNYTLLYWYLPVDGQERLRLCHRKMPGVLDRKERAQWLVKELATPNRHQPPPLPTATRLLRAKFIPPLLILNMNQALLTGTRGWGTEDELTAISCLIRTMLRNFPAITQVQILVEGQSHQTLAGHIDISHPLRYQ